MATNHTEYYWDGAWHSYPKGKQPQKITVEVLSVPDGMGGIDDETFMLICGSFGIPPILAPNEDSRGNPTGKLHKTSKNGL